MSTKTKERLPAWPVQSSEYIHKVRIKLSELDPALFVAHEAVEPFDWQVRENGISGLVQLITEQQVSTASAAAIWRRFKSGVGEVSSTNLLNFDIDALKSFGLSRPKALYVHKSNRPSLRNLRF